MGEKKKLEQEVSSLKLDLDSKVRELDGREQYRKEMDQRTTDMITMLKEKDVKIDELSRVFYREPKERVSF